MCNNELQAHIYTYIYIHMCVPSQVDVYVHVCLLHIWTCLSLKAIQKALSAGQQRRVKVTTPLKIAGKRETHTPWTPDDVPAKKVVVNPGTPAKKSLFAAGIRPNKNVVCKYIINVYICI